MLANSKLIQPQLTKNSQRGFTLIELVMGIVVFGVVLAIISTLIAPSTRGSFDPFWQTRATELSESLINEISAKSFDEQSDRSGGMMRCNETGACLCTQSGNLGPDTGETRDLFDDVEDYLSFINNAGNGLSISLVGTPPAPILSNIDVADGRGTITFGLFDMKFNKSSTPVVGFPTDMDLSIGADFLTDDSGVCYQPNYPAGCEAFVISNITGTEQRYGRLRMINAYGPENESLALPIVIDQFTNSGWLVNTDDNNTPLNLSQTNGQINVALNPDSANDVLSLIPDVNVFGAFNQGQSAITFDPPDLPSSLDVRLDPTILNPEWAEYLNVDWNMDGVIDATDSPSATVSFGIFRGNDRKINIREVMP